MGSVLKLSIYILGVYGCFLSWGILQERLSTNVYSGESDAEPFTYFLFLNLCMSVCASILSLLAIRSRSMDLGLKDTRILFDYVIVSITISIASPFGYEALKHINYPTVLLGKSCKLLPVMLMNFLIYRKQFAWYKYVSVALVTAGVSGFMLYDPKSQKDNGQSNSLFGIGLLLTNLLIDGITNSLQDKIFIKYNVRSLQMMFFMNLLSSFGMFLYTLLNNEFLSALSFILVHDQVLRDILLFSICGSLGQLFIFSLLEEFGSLTLVTVTVTRKLFTILLSLFLFQHPMNPEQWIFVALVFVGILVEAFMKMDKSSKVRSVEKSKSE